MSSLLWRNSAVLRNTFFIFQNSFSAQAYGFFRPKIRCFTFSLYVKYLYFGRKMEIISVTIWYMMHDQPLMSHLEKKINVYLGISWRHYCNLQGFRWDQVSFCVLIKGRRTQTWNTQRQKCCFQQRFPRLPDANWTLYGFTGIKKWNSILGKKKSAHKKLWVSNRFICPTQWKLKCMGKECCISVRGETLYLTMLSAVTPTQLVFYIISVLPHYVAHIHIFTNVSIFGCF